jgi:hypothetical protein
MTKKISLALGSGGARGLAHIGAIEVLEREGYQITSVSGTSIGSVIGGLYAADKLEPFKEWICNLDKKGVLGLMDWTLNAQGFIKGDKVFNQIKKIDGVHRNIWRATQFMTIPEGYKGRMLDVGFTHFENRSAKVAIRMFALKTITPLVEEHPELKEEIRAIIEYSWEGSTAGFKSIARNTLKKWDRKYS